jgi:peptidoglycan hydrolase-like protein with peptidoglycan-binding domain
VLNAQTLLKKLGIPFGALDGLYGPKTAAAWAKAVAKYPPAQGPEYERRGTFTRVNGTTALVYRPSAERLAAVATGKAAPVSSAVTPRKPTLSAPSGFAASLAPKPSGRTPPPGYDRRAAQAMAPALVKHLKARGRDGYARAEMRKFQTYAGIAADGIYGRGSYAALKHFAPNAPAPFYAQGTAVYPWA